MKKTQLGLLAVATLAGLLPALPAAAAVPPQEPGVTLRTFDLQTARDTICTLKPSQTPNVDKLLPTINWTTAGEFGLENYFQSEVIANLNITTSGTYGFRLTSDDGSRLLIDSATVINNDGAHGSTAVEGAATLSTGYHPLHIDYFERDGGQQLTLEWRAPGATAYSVVPSTALSTDSGVVRVTAPGRKECEGAADSGGDGLPLTGVHPGYTLTNLRPSGFQPQVSAMDWFPDGRLAIATWGGSDTVAGEVYILSGVTGNTSPSQVTYRKIASGLREPMGLKIVDGKIYVSQKHELTELNDTNGDGTIDNYRRVATWPFDGNFHEFAFGLLYQDGYFYLNLSVSINLGGATTDPQGSPNRGTTLKINRSTGAVQYVAGGLRTPNGLNFGPDGDIFVLDNQGGWLPASKLVQIKQDRFFGHYTNPDGPFDASPVTRPVLWMPQNEIANSPSTPVLVKEGPYRGQLLIGDVTYGGLQRAYLETVRGQEQGALFRHTQGLEAGINEVSVGPDGDIYLGGLGADGNWGQEGKLRFGLQKLTRNGTNVFDMKTMSATGTGFKIEYTKQLSDETIAKLPAAFQAEQWTYVASSQYGGPKVDQESLQVTGVSIAPDRKTVKLDIAGLKRDHVVHLRSPRPFAARDGEGLWSTEAWYTLNEIPGVEPEQQVFYELEAGPQEGGATFATDHRAFTGVGFVAGLGVLNASTTVHVKMKQAGDYAVGLRYSNGPNPFSGTKTVSAYVNGRKVKQISLPTTVTWEDWATATATLPLRKGQNTITYRVDFEDTGHVNLDAISIRKPGERIALIDGHGLSNWQHTDGRFPEWPAVEGNAVEVCCGDLRTKEAFGDYKLHVEFKVPLLPPDVTGQNRGNSGVYQQERYELQILDSYGDTTLDNNEAGAIYTIKAPDVNAATPPETWQTYDVDYRAARYDASGTKTENARITVIWNGVKVQDNVELPHGTGGNIAEGPSTGAIRLQDHGNKVRYRNVWIEPS